MIGSAQYVVVRGSSGMSRVGSTSHKRGQDGQSIVESCSGIDRAPIDIFIPGIVESAEKA